MAAAQREAAEEAGIRSTLQVYPLDARCMVPVADVGGFVWGPDASEIPEYAFAVAVDTPELRLSQEHTEYRWVTYEEGLRLLYWDSNKVALGELNQRLTVRDEN